MPAGPVAVLDIGSNSIKALVAARNGRGDPEKLHADALDARISAGIGQDKPRLTEAGIERGVDAVRALLGTVERFGPSQTVIVATSAVRDASNGPDFCARIRATTGHAVRILSGAEEASLIGRGLTADPALRHLRDFYVFDLGGGSLECLAFQNREVVQAGSLPLGCVRLTEKFVADVTQPFTPAAAEQIERHTQATLFDSDFTFSLPAGAIAVGTGGTLTTARSIFAAREMKSWEEVDPVLRVSELKQLLMTLGEMPLDRRRKVSGLPRARADIFPAALATLIAVAATGRFDAYHHSMYNLRYGIAADLLAREAGGGQV